MASVTTKPEGHQDHDIEELEEVYRCCTCGVDIPKNPPKESSISVDIESDGSGGSFDIAVTKKW